MPENTELDKQLQKYFLAKENSDLLNENNKILLSNVDTAIALLPEESPLKKYIYEEMDKHYSQTSDLANTKSFTRVRALPATIKTPNNLPPSKVAFVNIAIIIYAVLNIGIILAIALMK